MTLEKTSEPFTQRDLNWLQWFLSPCDLRNCTLPHFHFRSSTLHTHFLIKLMLKLLYLMKQCPNFSHHCAIFMIFALFAYLCMTNLILLKLIWQSLHFDEFLGHLCLISLHLNNYKNYYYYKYDYIKTSTCFLFVLCVFCSFSFFSYFILE